MATASALALSNLSLLVYLSFPASLALAKGLSGGGNNANDASTILWQRAINPTLHALDRWMYFTWPTILSAV